MTRDHHCDNDENLLDFQPETSVGEANASPHIPTKHTQYYNHHSLDPMTSKRLCPAVVRDSPTPFWLVDSGASCDAIERRTLRQKDMRQIHDLITPLQFDTAAGTIRADKSVSLHSRKIGDIDAVVLSDAPPLTSIGKRCMNDMSFTGPNIAIQQSQLH